MRLICLLLLLPLIVFPQKNWTGTGGFTTNVDKLSLRTEPRKDAAIIDVFSLGKTLYWTGKTSLEQETIELRGEQRTDYWYQVVGEGLNSISIYLVEMNRLKAMNAPVETRNSLNVKKDTGWVFGGGLQVRWVNFPQELVENFYETPFLVLKKTTKKEFEEVKSKQKPQPNLLQDTKVSFPNKSTIVLSLDNGKTKVIADSSGFPSADDSDFTYAGYYPAPNLHLVWGQPGGDCGVLQLWDGKTGKRVFSECVYGGAMFFEPGRNRFAVPQTVEEYDCNDILFANRNGRGFRSFTASFSTPKRGAMEVYWKNKDELFVKQGEGEFFRFQILR